MDGYALAWRPEELNPEVVDIAGKRYAVTPKNWAWVSINEAD